MSSLSKLNKLFDRINNYIVILVGISLMIVVLCVAAGILSRLFGNSFAWVTEIGGYILVYIPFLVAAWVLRQEGHVVLDMVLTRFKPKTIALVNVITSIICAAVCLIHIWFGIKVTLDLYQIGYYTPTYLELPKFVFIAVVPFGSLLFFIQFLIRAYSYWTNRGMLADEKYQMTKNYGV